MTAVKNFLEGCLFGLVAFGLPAAAFVFKFGLH